MHWQVPRVASGNARLHAELRIFWVCGCLQPVPPAASADAGAGGALHLDPSGDLACPKALPGRTVPGWAYP